MIAGIVEYILQQQCALLEIGCGDGALTVPLAQQQSRVVGVEIDERWWRLLRAKLAPYPQVVIINQDFLTTAVWPLINAWWSTEQRIMVVANLPYHVGKQIMFKLYETTDLAPHRVAGWVLMMQAELADRLLARVNSSSYGFLSVVFQHWFQIKLLRKVSRQAFFPTPRVDSQVVTFTPRCPWPTTDLVVIKFIRQMFRLRRKTVANNLKRLVDATILVKVKRWRPRWMPLRPQNLTFSDFAALYQQIKVIRGTIASSKMKD